MGRKIVFFISYAIFIISIIFSIITFSNFSEFKKSQKEISSGSLNELQKIDTIEHSAEKRNLAATYGLINGIIICVGFSALTISLFLPKEQASESLKKFR